MPLWLRYLFIFSQQCKFKKANQKKSKVKMRFIYGYNIHGDSVVGMLRETVPRCCNIHSSPPPLRTLTPPVLKPLNCSVNKFCPTHSLNWAAWKGKITNIRLVQLCTINVLHIVVTCKALWGYHFPNVQRPKCTPRQWVTPDCKVLFTITYNGENTKQLRQSILICIYCSTRI